jgi:Phage shock protein B.
MISQLLTSGLLAAAHGVDAGDKPFIAFVVMMAPVMIVFLVFAPKILRELREWRRPNGLRKEDLAMLKRISEMLDKMESRVDALEIILGESNPQKKSQTSRTRAYGNQR